jgi:ATP-binding cassette subfamily B protein
VFIVATGWGLHAAATRDGAAWPPLVVAAAAFVLVQAFAPVQAAVGELIARRIDGDRAAALMAAAMAAPLPAVETDAAMTALRDAAAAFTQSGFSAGPGAAALLPLSSRYLTLASAVAVVGVTLSWPVAVLVAAGALVIRRGQRGSLDRFVAVWGGFAGGRRRLSYLRRFGIDSASAKELRALGLVGWLRRRHERESVVHLREVWVGRRSIYGGPFLGYSAGGLVVGALAFVGIALSPALRGDSLGLTVAVQALLVPLRFGVHFPECDVPTQFGMHAEQQVTGYRREMAAAAVAARSQPVPAGRAASSSAGPVTVRFEQVHFRYPNGERAVLSGFDLDLPAGTCTAIVGVNGAGKTTLVKLLAGFHRPDRGRITVDGVDLRDRDLAEWHRQLAVILQDFGRYKVTLRENVHFGALDRQVGDRDTAVRAALDRAGAGSLPRRLPAGLDTVLAPEYAGGVDLSGGQWQRVALARALYRVGTNPSVLVLDEPTAQLDVRSEVAFFDNFLSLTAGLTTVVISHRFSAVRRADRIIVLEQGRVVEQGSHAELLSRDGRYAAMFRLQAARFAAEPDVVTR